MRAPTNTCCHGGSAPRYEPSGTVYSGASPSRERTCASPFVLVFFVLSHSLFCLSVSFALSLFHRWSGFWFRFRTGSHAERIKIIFARFATRVCDDEVFEAIGAEVERSRKDPRMSRRRENSESMEEVSNGKLKKFHILEIKLCEVTKEKYANILGMPINFTC